MPSTRMLNGVAVLGLQKVGTFDNPFLQRLKDDPSPRRSSQVGAKKGLLFVRQHYE